MKYFIDPYPICTGYIGIQCYMILMEMHEKWFIRLWLIVFFSYTEEKTHLTAVIALFSWEDIMSISEKFIVFHTQLDMMFSPKQKDQM